jgi:hypothetical protein
LLFLISNYFLQKSGFNGGRIHAHAAAGRC